MFGRRLARRLFRLADARIQPLRGWLLATEESHRQQLRAALGAMERLEQQIDRFQCQVQVEIAEFRTEAQRESAAAGQRIEAAIPEQIGRVRGDLCRTAEKLSDQLALAAQDNTAIAARMEKQITGLQERTDPLSCGLAGAAVRSEQLSAEVAAVASSVAQLDGLIRTGLVRNCPSFSLDSSFPESESELVEVAESLAILRPLVPYPQWRFDADRYNPDLAFQVRQRVWQHFADRKYSAPVCVPWHLGTHLLLSLDNDLSSQVFIAGCVDPNEFAFLERFLQPGMTFIDVGANEGIYSIFAARRVGPSGTVWAFEPSRRELERLRRNAEYNRLDARIFAAGLSDSERVADLFIAEELHAWLNTLGKIPYEGVGIARTEHVQLVRLDDVVSENFLSHIDFIKVDVEGAELHALRGAVRTLRRYRPLLMFEVVRPQLAGQGVSPEELVEFVRQQGYTLYQFDPATGLPALAKPLEYSMNMIAVPEEATLPKAVYNYLPARLSAPASAI